MGVRAAAANVLSTSERSCTCVSFYEVRPGNRETGTFTFILCNMLRSRLHPTSTVYPAGMARQVLSCLMATATGCRHSIVSYATDFRLFRSSQSHSDQLEGGPSMQSSRRQIATTPSARPSILHSMRRVPIPTPAGPLFFYIEEIKSLTGACLLCKFTSLHIETIRRADHRVKKSSCSELDAGGWYISSISLAGARISMGREAVGESGTGI